MEARIIDTVGAFLYQAYPLDESPVYVRIHAKLMGACGIPSDTLYRVKKYIYGLPDSGRAYYFDVFWVQVELEWSLLVPEGGEAAGERIHVWTLVDDIFMAATRMRFLTITAILFFLENI